jgi:hypothetical protein
MSGCHTRSTDHPTSIVNSPTFYPKREYIITDYRDEPKNFPFSTHGPTHSQAKIATPLRPERQDWLLHLSVGTPLPAHYDKQSVAKELFIRVRRVKCDERKLGCLRCLFVTGMNVQAQLPPHRHNHHSSLPGSAEASDSSHNSQR